MTTTESRTSTDPPAPVSRPLTAAGAVAWLVLCAGLFVSVVGAVRWTDSVRDAERESFASQAEAVRAVVASELRADEALVASLQGQVEAHPDLTNAQFLRWYDASGTAWRFPGGIGFGYVQRVPAADLEAFAALAVADPVTGLDATGTFTVFPDETESEYCLQRVGIWKRSEIKGFSIPAGLNLCADELPGIGRSELPALLATVAEQGVPQVLPPEQFIDGSFAIVAPVYGETPADTAALVRAPSIGWVAGSFDTDLLTSAALSGTTGVSVDVRRTAISGETFSVSSGGSESTTTSIDLPVNGDSGWSVVVGGTPSIPGASPFTQGIAFLIGGVLLSVAAFALIRVLANSRARALTLANTRTAEMDYRSLHDELTGLPNRTLLLDRITQMQARSMRPSTPVAALSIEIDNFESVNDTLGHHASDQLIAAVATRISSALRETDTVGRLGNNGFVVLVQGELPLASPELAAQRIIDILAEPFAVGGSSTPIIASIGIAVGPRTNPVELLRDADVAMYRAKDEGRGGYVVFDPEMGVAMAERVEIERDLRRALERNQLFLQYQPTFDLRSGTITGVEALVRWQHPTRGLIPPDDFIPFAEVSLRIVPIGRWVLHEACRRGAEWSREGHPVRVAVNMSTVQIEDDHFINDVKEALTESGLPAAQLVLELTETALLRDTTVVRFRLEALKELGVGISIDDFGTGYTSITYLQQFPVDTIKIDKSFVDHIAESPDAAALSRTLVQLGRSLGLETLAEGIETPAQLAELIVEGCDSGQGYLNSRPLDADAVSEFLSRPTPPLHPSWSEPTRRPVRVRRPD